MTARIPLLLAVRFRLAPWWLVSRVRRNPAPAVLAAGVAVVVAGLVALAVSAPSSPCHLRAAAGAVRPHWACVRGGAR